jgi:hypothetical protein
MLLLLHLHVWPQQFNVKLNAVVGDFVVGARVVGDPVVGDADVGAGVVGDPVVGGAVVGAGVVEDVLSNL